MQDLEAGMSLGQDTERLPELCEGEGEDCDVKSERMAGQPQRTVLILFQEPWEVDTVYMICC